MAEERPQENQGNPPASPKNPIETEILNVHVERKGQEVTANWGLHPSLKAELTAEEWKDLTNVMSKVTGIVGKRFAEILARGQKEAGGTA
ncbi:hypothetical protein [Candidatus Nitronereus thalassa]|uniref:Uncharacterized protein n=1 Tax=Candidatus Nitronereus thalassa TaxID=3020898 RepID=A0ABU3K8H9_9BACT|nr:hypothetical protein [Candidatus Nitronereus thalassa]MDT7042693.1 hypothetical protein [Candidatus Nitronereus thalassa]